MHLQLNKDLSMLCCSAFPIHVECFLEMQQRYLQKDDNKVKGIT